MEPTTIRALLKAGNFPFQGDLFTYRSSELRLDKDDPMKRHVWVDLTVEDILEQGYISCESYWNRAKESDYDNEFLFFSPEHMSGSDYSGGSLTRSNHDEFAKLLEEHDVPYCEIHGGYSTYGIAIHADTVLPEEVLDCLEALEDYPCIDDEALSLREMKIQDEAWESDYRKEFIQAIEKALDIEIHDNQKEAIDTLFRASCETANEYWVIETGEIAYIRLDKIVKHIDLDTLDEHKIQYSSIYGPTCPKCQLGNLSLPGEYVKGIQICDKCRQEFKQDENGRYIETKHFTA